MPISPDVLINYLRRAERDVFKGSIIIARQRALIARLESQGRDTAIARHLLHEFEERQSAHLETRDKLTKELARIAPP